MPKGRSPSRPKRRDPPMKDLLSWPQAAPWRRVGSRGEKGGKVNASVSRVGCLMEWDDASKSPHTLSNAPKGKVKDRWVSEAHSSFTYYARAAGMPRDTVSETSTVISPRRIETNDRPFNSYGDSEEQDESNNEIKDGEVMDVGTEGGNLSSEREEKIRSFDASPLFAKEIERDVDTNDDDDNEWVVLDKDAVLPPGVPKMTVDTKLIPVPSAPAESDSETVISPKRSGRPKKKKKKKTQKKPPFCLYGRSNFGGPSSGVGYGNYLRSHNVLPDRYPNKPSFPQSFKAAGRAARIVGGGGQLNDELTQTIVASAERDAIRRVTRVIAKLGDDFEPESPTPRHSPLVEAASNEEKDAPPPPVVEESASGEKGESNTFHDAPSLPRANVGSSEASELSETARFLADARSETFVPWKPIEHVERDPHTYKNLPPAWTKSIIAAGVKTPRGESVADVLYLYD